jgi:hypothetical protein
MGRSSVECAPRWTMNVSSGGPAGLPSPRPPREPAVIASAVKDHYSGQSGILHSTTPVPSLHAHSSVSETKQLFFQNTRLWS